MGKFKQTTTFKLQPSDDASSDVARIESNSELDLDQPRAGKATLKQQKQTGTILFDHMAGRLRSAEVEQQLVTASSLKDTPIQVKLISTMKMTLDAR